MQVVVFLQRRVLVRAEVKTEAVAVGLRSVRNRELGMELFDISAARGECFVLQRGVLEVVSGDQDRREELLLEGHPLDLRVDRLVLGLLRYAQFLDRVVAREIISDRRVVVLVIEALLVLRTHVLPVDFQIALIRRQQVVHSHEPDVEVDHVVVPTDRIEVFDIRCGIDVQPHGEVFLFLAGRESQSVRIDRFEIVLARVDLGVVVSFLDEEGEIEHRGRVGEQQERSLTVGLIVFQLDRRDAASLIREADFQQVVLDRVECFSAFGRRVQITAQMFLALLFLPQSRAVRRRGRRCGIDFGRDRLDRQRGSGRRVDRSLLPCYFRLLLAAMPCEYKKNDAYDK